MLLRRSRFVSPVLNLFILTVSAYLVLCSLLATNSVTDEKPKREKLRTRINGHLPLDVATGGPSRNDRPLPVKSLRPARRSHDLQTTETVTGSSYPSSPRRENGTDEGLATGYERKLRTFKQGNAERAVRRMVSRFRTRPPKSVRYSSGNWQVVDVDVEGHVYIYSAFYDSRPNLDWPQVRIGLNLDNKKWRQSKQWVSGSWVSGSNGSLF